MNKSTIFTVFLAGLMMVVLTELLVDRFFADSSHLKADVLQNTLTQETENNSMTLQSSPINIPPSLNTPKPSAVDTSSQQTFSITLQSPPVKQDTSSNLNTENSNVGDTSKITFPILQKAGFETSTLQRIPFDGLLLGKLEVKDSLTLPVIVQNLLKNNVAKVATFYEFQTKSKTLADHLFASLKDKFSRLKESSVNPTDEFVEHSFYINFPKEPKNAFLVVKKGENVYALTYQKESHPFIQMLLPLLP